MKINSPIRIYKILVFLITSLLCSSMGLAQQVKDDEVFKNKDDLEAHSISIYGEDNLFYQAGDNAYTFGGRLDLSAGFFGFYYKVGLGVNPEGKLYGHIPLGLEVGAIIVASSWRYTNVYYLWVPALLCAIVPEGVTARIWTKNHYNLKLYLSPWGSELNISKENFTLVSGEFGVQANVINKHRYNLSCYAGAKVLYKHFQPAATVGATIGILLH
jgi:hypothetical protein